MLSCWGGNLFVPKHIFLDVAKFQKKFNPDANKDDFCGYDEWYTAPTEDGDFGITLIKQCEWPVSLNKEIRGYHMWHPRNIKEIQDKNIPNVDYLNRKHRLDVYAETETIQRQEYKI